VVDAFTDKIFSGNPAGVCVLEEWLSDQVLRSVANELNLAETAFLLKENDGYGLRWFTPEEEVKLCGHATLAAAHILWTEGLEKTDRISFSTLSGTLFAERIGPRIQMDFPSHQPRQVQTPPEAEKMLRQTVLSSSDSELYFVFEIPSEQGLRTANVDMNLIGQFCIRNKYPLINL
jgi:PhzF family phenazine biosynthesis protein